MRQSPSTPSPLARAASVADFSIGRLIFESGAAAAGALSGVIVGGPGYVWLNVFAGLFAVGTLAAAVLSRPSGAMA